MEINNDFLNEILHALEMNGRQFILREAKIKEMKSAEIYEVPHGNDLIYYSIKSGILNSIGTGIFNYLSMKNDGAGIEVALRSTIEVHYKALKDLGSHDDFMKAMDAKYKAS
jgi:hypothetical protein